jgi:hypothetical protein
MWMNIDAYADVHRWMCICGCMCTIISHTHAWRDVYHVMSGSALFRRMLIFHDFPMFRLHAQIQPPYGLCEVKPLLGIFRNEIAETCRLQSWNKSWTSTRLSSRLWKHVLYIKINQNLNCLLWSSIYIYTYICVCFYKWHFQRVHSIGQDLPQCWRSVKVSDLMDLWNTSDSLSKHFALGAGLW